jgi:putative ABC transport system ATP-binding protein
VDGSLPVPAFSPASTKGADMLELLNGRESALVTRGVVLARNGKAIARLPDIDLATGRSVAIVGPSGSGKTTALLALAAVRPPLEGKITIDGTNPWQLGRSARDGFRGRRIGLVFQSFYLVDALTVAGNIRLAAQCAGHPLHEPHRLDDLLQRLDLTGIRASRADRISYGQAQRVAVARALINRPAVVLGDELTSALDDGHAAGMMELLSRSAAEENAALVIATHDRRILQSVDRIVEMEVLS